MKTDIHLRLDVDVIKLAKAKNTNISEICNNYLKEYLQFDKELPSEKEELLNERVRLEVELNQIRAKENIMADKEQQALQKKIKAKKEKEQIKEELMERIRKKELVITRDTPEELQAEIDRRINEEFNNRHKND